MDQKINNMLYGLPTYSQNILNQSPNPREVPMKVDIINYTRDMKEEYVFLHNVAFAGPDSVYTRTTDGYNEDKNILKTYVAVYKNTYVGFVDVVELKNERSKVEIDPVAVLPEYKNKGIGSVLVAKALAWSRKKGYKKVRAVVSAQAQDRLKNFFTRKGFQLVSQIFASKEGDISEISLHESSPYPPEKIKGHVFVYELSLL